MRSTPTHLVVLTNSWPHSGGELFLENEIPYLVASFDHVTIVVTGEGSQDVTSCPRSTGLRILRFAPGTASKRQAYKLLALSGLFHVASELRYVLGRLKLPLSWRILKTLAVAYLKALSVAEFVGRWVGSDSRQAYFLYAYWNDWTAHAVALLKQRYPGVVGVARLHGWDVYADRHPGKYLPFKDAIFRSLDRNYFVSQDGLDYAVRHLHADPRGLRVSRLGTKRRRPVRPGLDPGMALDLISVSRVAQLKRLHLIVGALACLDIAVRWTHVGGGDLLESIKALAAASLGDKKSIATRFVGPVDNEEVLTILHDLRNPLFINVSSTEGVSVSIMEAMSAGIPVVATAVGGTPEIVRSGVNGFLLDANPSPESIAERIAGVHALDRAERHRLRAGALETWERDYNADVNYPQFIRDVLSLRGVPVCGGTT